jgi:hypothetical protein
MVVAPITFGRTAVRNRDTIRANRSNLSQTNNHWAGTDL